MKFNFRTDDGSVIIQIKVSKELYDHLKTIGDQEGVLRHDAVIVLLEGAVREYFDDPQYNAPPQSDSPVRWHKKYDRCISCKTTERVHFSGGLCSRCYRKKKILQEEPSYWKKHHNMKEMIHCQYASCPDKSKIYQRSDMIRYKDFFFCSDSCRQAVINLESQDNEQAV